jgi:hypothetical protein
MSDDIHSHFSLVIWHELISTQSACLLLRVDDICSAKAARQAGGGGAGPQDD